MYLKALEIQGFKSFPDKTRLSFEKDITAIVGPNGSGKSNISDAVLWVMGEQRSKALRGSKMEDVIFGGTEKRSALGFAQVSLIIDNSAHIFDYEGSEIMLSRRYYRSGESEYYINREAVRLKDINSLLMDTGLGRDGYSIIGQGRIAEIVSTKSTDRREIFEEAAGISRYRYRKEEAERKLERTEENLLRINDKIEELEMQVGPLKKQAEDAKRYLSLRDELKSQEISLWMETLDRLREQAAAIEREHRQAEENLERARHELEALYASSDNLAERIQQKNVETEQTRERLSEQETMLSECESAMAVIRANIKSKQENIERMLSDIEQQNSRVDELRLSVAENKAKISQSEAQLKALREEEAQNENVLEGCRIKLSNREAIVRDLSEKTTQLEIDCGSMESRIRMLTELEKDYEGYSKAVKTVMREAGRGNLKGIHAPLANLLKTKDEFALAIETALGAAAQNIVADTQDDGRRAIEMLKRMDAGRATFLPLDAIRGNLLQNVPVNDPGFVGIAYELVDFDEKYKQIFLNTLGRTVIAESLSDAVRISRANDNKLRIVTLDGQLISAGGAMTGGSTAKNTGIISRANELEKLKVKRAKATETLKNSSLELERAKAKQAAVRYELDTALEESAQILSRIASAEAEQRTTELNLSQLELLLDSLTGDSETRQRAVSEFEADIEGFKARLAAKQSQAERIRSQITALRAEIDTISNQRLELESKRTRAEKDTQARNTEIIELQQTLGSIKQRKTAAEMEEKQLLDKLWENYELSHSAAMSLRRPIESVQKASHAIAELRRAMSALGNPNLGAIDEYERVSTRYEFLSSQRDDVEKAKADLLSIINEVTSQMKEVFIEQFKAIDASFRETFLELFGGGKAALVLEDENNILECGIDIKVQPPGKALSNISLLSGGEMAFVAIALYFAILKVRPTPFCVMDEIEAALDEANVDRFADYMRRMSEKTQFLVITHRRGTMEEADMLYGVTMQEKGVSTVIELDLESARKTAET